MARESEASKEQKKKENTVPESNDSDGEGGSSIPEGERGKASSLIIDKYAKWSFGVGLIPIPIVDLVALTTVHIKMLSEISNVYDLEFSDNRIRSITGAVLAGAFPQSVNRLALGSFIKKIPVLGTTVAALTMPVASAAATYAIGTVFVKHFESGGTFLDVDISSMSDQVKKISDKYKKDKKNKDSSVGSEVPSDA